MRARFRLHRACVWSAWLALFSPGAAHAQLWSRPVTCSDCITDFYYVDQGGFGQDWNCGNSTYSDHSGTDYSLRNGNFAIDADNEVVAMAQGVVVSTQDGYYDRCTQCGGFNCGTSYGNGFANQVIVNHGDYRVIYGHMKQGSVAVKQGDSVACGQVLGFIGSSGCSTGAHLHIEPSLAAQFGVAPYEFIDPHVGACSPTTSSLWSDQGAYRVLPGAACDGEPPVPACPAETYPIWTCLPDGSARRRCADGVVADEACAWGCSVMAAGTDDACELPPDGDADGSRADVDCDDASDARHPGALDACGDGVDQDCSGADLPCAVDAPIPSAGGGGQAGAVGYDLGVGGSAAPAGAPGLIDPATASGPSGTVLSGGQAGQLAPQSASASPAPGLATPTVTRGAEAAGCSVRAIAPQAGPSAWPGLAALCVLVGLRRLRRLRAESGHRAAQRPS